MEENLEALVNLYYNQKIDLDLSELEIANCCINNRNTYKNGLIAPWVCDFLKDHGVCEEASYPFVDDPNDTICRSDNINPLLNVRIGDYKTWYSLTEDTIKKIIINYGPLMSGFFVQYDSTTNGKRRSHSMALVGYGTIHAGDSIREIIERPPSTFSHFYTIPENSPLIGRTYFKFKNSNNTRINDDVDGYMYLMFHNILHMIYPIQMLPPFTVTDNFQNLPMYSDEDVVCEDRDGDGYYFWGIGNKPASCPFWVPNQPDGDDSDYQYGSMDEFGNLTDLTTLSSDTLVVDDIMTYDSRQFIYNSIKIINGGSLHIGTTVTMYGECCIVVEDGGSLIVDNGTIEKANIQIKEGGYMGIKNKGYVTLRPNGTVDVSKGATLDLEKGEIAN